VTDAQPDRPDPGEVVQADELGASPVTPACEVCGGPGGVVRDVPLATIACDGCWQAAGDDSEPPSVPRRPEPVEMSDPRDPAPVTCRRCGLPGQWYPTLNDRRVLMEPQPVPICHVPPGQRWRIAGDGTAINIGRAYPADECRITHWLICPAVDPSPPLQGHLRQVWVRRRRLRARG
jgi:hypothetical protein